MNFPPFGETFGVVVVDSISGNLVDTISGTITPACVNMLDGKVVRIEHKVAAPPVYILPGLIDAHIHIESTMLTPYRFAEQVVPHGTTAVVADPHEIANVAGMSGIEWMIDDGKKTPLHFYYAAPSSVPSVDAETSGARLGWEDIRALLSRKEFVALGEVMNYAAVLAENPDTLGKIEIASQLGKPVDGHCPGLHGYDLDRYIMAGVSTDHESTTLKEAEEKARRGMIVMVREGSVAKNMVELLPFAKTHQHFLVTDDVRASDLLYGHVDELLRKAVAGGVDPVQAVRAVTLWPAQHYGLPGGSLYIGGPADLTVVSDLKEFKVLETWIDGKQVAKDGAALFLANPSTLPPMMPAYQVPPVTMTLPAIGSVARVRVIEVQPGQVTSRAGEAELPIVDGAVAPSSEMDIAMLAVINRYAEAKPAVAMVKGFGLHSGALASSVAHDAHNLIVVGTHPIHMYSAIEGLLRQGGGYFVTDGTKSAGVPLPAAGLMSDRPCAEVAADEDAANALVRELGCPLEAPFMTLSFQSLLMVPELKLSDRGLYDSRNRVFVSPVIATDRGSMEPPIHVEAEHGGY